MFRGCVGSLLMEWTEISDPDLRFQPALLKSSFPVTINSICIKVDWTEPLFYIWPIIAQNLSCSVIRPDYGVGRVRVQTGRQEEGQGPVP